MEEMDKNQDGKIDFEEFFAFAKKLQLQIDIEEGKVPATMILIGRAKVSNCEDEAQRGAKRRAPPLSSLRNSNSLALILMRLATLRLASI